MHNYIGVNQGRLELIVIQELKFNKESNQFAD